MQHTVSNFPDSVFWLTGQQQRLVTAVLSSFSNFPPSSSCISVPVLLNIPLFHMLLLCNLSSTLWLQWEPNDLFMLMDFPCLRPDPSFSHSQLLLDVASGSNSTLLHAWVTTLPVLPVLQPWHQDFVNGPVKDFRRNVPPVRFVYTPPQDKMNCRSFC